ncbi:PREDICTED: V-type proton ATPase 116 kDa subunit a isoform 1 isoform X2 [Ceratosolen solmsi marchali]|uniref:V-type proton ATPase subunit a n=1 Tax=Ceratosolen solmsi marchali TaxID=326594 RepID=A0AAJ6YFZ6_9HYME|nr:PREDICTED: V-type proton ATPase 116 kDa subunit a isoform 1 isoform X2 [Ceratosolen solmsi marchali]
MGALFRSEEMALCQLFIQPEAAYLSVSELGETGTVQFRDLNGDVNYFQRKFVNEVRRCDEMERKLRYIEAEVKKDGVPIEDNLTELPRAPNPREIIDLEARIEKTENDILELSQNAVNLKSNYLELMELRHVLEKTQVFFTEEEANDSITRALINEETQIQNATGRGRLEFVAGVINRERMPAFERMLWRISRGNVFLRQASLEKPLEDPSTGNEIYKTAFVAFFQGEQLKSRIKKVCSGFHASLYPCPSSHGERMDMVKGVRTRLEDLNLVLNQTHDHRQRVLHNVAKELPNWTIMVRKMKAIYHTMNLFNMDVSKKCLIGECWVPMADLTIVQNCLSEGSRLCGNSIPSFLNVIHTDEDPPTFNRTNRFTRGFQNLIDAYGVASYREANPALYTIVTFPFLFSIMFGDAGHGLIMFLFGAYMVGWEKKLLAKRSTNEIWNIFFGGRYIILLMGLFSIYTGIIYNDVFSKSVNVFRSNWYVNDNYTLDIIQKSKMITLDPKDSYVQYPYPVGMDPVWMLAENKIIFLNSYKMKLSIIFGVVHMIFGVCMSVVNIVHFKKYASFFLEFLPQLIFLLLLFAYLVSLMFIKWVIYSASNKGRYSESCAPSILITFINMMLFGSSKVPPGCDEFMFTGQAVLQKVCVFSALACIPLLLFGKPLFVLCTKKNAKGKVYTNGSASHQDIELQTSNGSASPSNATATVHEDHDSFGEIMIHQAIHTIEYILSTISHTASYLRLWALSLAHAQLSEVLWNMVLHFGLGAEGDDWTKSLFLFVAFGAWAFFTLAILVMMEGLSAFLHTLRLHWVEFMSKFYEGQGYAFQPFCFKTILDAEDSSEQD